MFRKILAKDHKKTTGRNLDLRINGEGFFRMSDDGALKYSRAGAFHLDKDGLIVNSLEHNLTGFTVDEDGVLTGAVGNLQISTANQQPKATDNIVLEMNLDAEVDIPTLEFQRGFTADNPPDTNSYNKLENTVVYDSLGTSHILSKYFVKTNIDNRWDVYVGIDGNDVTPEAAAAPAVTVPIPGNPNSGNNQGSDPIPKPNSADWQNYSPFTVVFDNLGKFIANDPNVPPKLLQTPIAYSPSTNAYDGSNPPGSESLTVTPAVNNPWKMVSTVTDPSTLKGPNGNNLAIEVRNASGGFTSYNVAAMTGSGNPTARRISDAINATGTLNTLVDAYAYTEFELGEYFSGTAVATFDLTAAGTNATATSTITIPAGTNVAGVLAAINAETATTGVYAVSRDIAGDTANVNRKRIVLVSDGYDSTGTPLGATAMDLSGHNITLTMTGTSTTPLFQNYDTSSTGLALTQRGAVTVRAETVSADFKFSGSDANAMGFETGRIYEAVVDQENSDVISINWTPTTAGPATKPTDPQQIIINMATSTQYGDPFAVTDKTQDGFTTGRLSGIEVDKSGIIFARYSNGQSSTLGKVGLVNFPNENGLSPVGNTQWVESFSSGQPLIGEPQTANFGSIEALTLEDSNVDLTQELVSMIIAQRNFQANAQTIRTSDQVTQTIINIR
ncbi:hypothetical protein DA717_05855 [Piscirickettsiaceae bacterium NZ-RLO2]|nr:hypothetical protein DA717_05855 [Piscirickettsiaceae bacterium NZ-RLO2]